MADMLETGSRWLHVQRHANMTQSVTVSRGSNSVTLLATRTESEHRYVDAYGVIVKTVMRGYIIRAQDYILAGAVVTPAEGDLIADNGYTFMCVTPGGGVAKMAGLQAWEYPDGERENLVLHVKEV